MYRKILAPLDGSALAEQALPHARTLAEGLRVPVHLFTVLDQSFVERRLDAGGEAARQIEEDDRAAATQYLEERAGFMRQAGLEVSVSWAAPEGGPANLIAHEAEREPGTLVVMASRGRSGLTRWLLGSVADRLIRSTMAPVWLVRPSSVEQPPESPDLRTLVTPLDGSAVAEQALPHAAAVARALGLGMVLARVTRDPAYYIGRGGGGGRPQAQAIEREEQETATQYLADVAQRLRDQGVTVLGERVLSGDAADGILQVAEPAGSAIAICTNGFGGISRLVMGSVAGRIVQYAERPVLVVRAQETG